MSFGTLLKTARKDKELSQSKLAELIGVNRVAISNYEQDKNTPTYSNIKKIVNALNLSAEYFADNINTSKVKYIPLIGTASCGVPNLSYNDYNEMIAVDESIARDGVYAIKADGESMFPKINNGDIVICDINLECRNGDIVHYNTIDGESGIKKLSLNNDVATLYPINANGQFSPIVCPINEIKCARAFKSIINL